MLHPALTPARGPLARHGTLAVPQSDDALYQQAKSYLSRDPVEAKLFRALEHSPDGRHYELSINNRNDDHFDPNDDEIAWRKRRAITDVIRHVIDLESRRAGHGDCDCEKHVIHGYLVTGELTR